MENKELNLCKILKDCPKGTKLWSPVWGNVTLIQINDISLFPIVLSADGFNNVSLHSDGKCVFLIMTRLKVSQGLLTIVQNIINGGRNSYDYRRKSKRI